MTHPGTPPERSNPASGATLVEVGRQHAAQLCRMELSDYRWMFSGLGGADVRDLNVYLAFTRLSLDLLQERATAAGTSPAWEGARSELRAASNGTSADALHAALLDVLRRHQVPLQLPFDLFDGIDWWIRFGRFATYDEWGHFAAQLGGSTLHAIVAIIGCDRRGYETAATKAGQALALTQILSRCGVQGTADRCWLPLDVVSQCHLEPGDWLADDHGRRFAGMVRGLAARVELEFFEGAALAAYLNFDGQRVLKSLFTWHWHLLNRIKQDPLQLLHGPVQLSRAEQWSLRFSHWLGTEGSGNPLVAAMQAAAHPGPGGH